MRVRVGKGEVSMRVGKGEVRVKVGKGELRVRATREGRAEGEGGEKER